MATSMLFLVVSFASIFLTSCENSAAKINVTLYYESLCPDSRDLIVHQLYRAYEKVSGIFNVELVPYGNAQETKRGKEWDFDCQHGKIECICNLIETCAIHFSKNKSSESPVEFVHCFEKNIVDGTTVENPLSVAEQCAEDLDIAYPPIEDCQKGMLGNALQHQMALKTSALRPAHKYVPWVTLNGKHSEEIQEQAEGNLIKLLCKLYTGTKPPACRDVHEGRCYNNGKQKHHFDYYSIV